MFGFGSDAFGSLGGFWGADKTTLHHFARGRLASLTGLPSMTSKRICSNRGGFRAAAHFAGR
jgi:hypothetical protein